MRARIGTALTAADGKPEVEEHGGDRHGDVHRERPPPRLGHGVAERARERGVRPARPACVGELEDPLRARVDRPVHRVAEARHLRRRRARISRASSPGSRPAATASSRSRAHSSEVPSTTGPAPRMPGRDRALQRARIGGERHPRRDVRGHHPVLGDRHEQQVEEEALLLGRLLAGQQQVEVLGEAQPAHQVAGEVAAAHLDAVGVGLADAADLRRAQGEAIRASRPGRVRRAHRPRTRARRGGPGR